MKSSSINVLNLEHVEPIMQFGNGMTVFKLDAAAIETQDGLKTFSKVNTVNDAEVCLISVAASMIPSDGEFVRR